MKDPEAWKNILRLIKEDFEGNESAFVKAIKFPYGLFEKNKVRSTISSRLLRSMLRNKGISADYIIHGLGPKYR